MSTSKLMFEGKLPSPDLKNQVQSCFQGMKARELHKSFRLVYRQHDYQLPMFTCFVFGEKYTGTHTHSLLQRRKEYVTKDIIKANKLKCTLHILFMFSVNKTAYS